MGRPHDVALEITGSHMTGYVNGRKPIEGVDTLSAFDGGGIGLLVEEGSMSCEGVRVEALAP